MKKNYGVIFGKYRKFKNPKISCVFEKIVVISISCSKFKNEDEKLFKEEQSTVISKILGLIKKYIITLKMWLKKT